MAEPIANGVQRYAAFDPSAGAFVPQVVEVEVDQRWIR
jgi:hypothetical protein